CVTEAMSRAVLMDRSLLDRCRSRVVDLLGSNRGAVVRVKIGGLANTRVFSKGGAGGKSKGSGSKNNLLHFPISLESGAAFVRRSDAVEMGDNEQKFQSRKRFLDHTFVQPILRAINSD